MREKETRLGQRETSFATRLTDDPRYSRMSPRKLLEREIQTEVMELVPVREIVLEASIIDEKHVVRLASSMMGFRGQISPMTVRARLSVDQEIHYDIVDGFHRAEALVAIKRPLAKCVVVYGCSDEELFDLRVLAASSVKSVQFSRVARWMQNSFKNTEWAQKGLTLAQVYGLVVMDTNGSKLGLTNQETEALKAWAKAKADKWDQSVTYIWETMRAVENAAPDLVMAVRQGGGGKGGKGVLSPARFKEVVSQLPGEHDLQRRVVRAVLDHNLIAEEAGALAKLVNEAPDGREVENLLKDPVKSVGRMGGDVPIVAHRERKPREVQQEAQVPLNSLASIDSIHWWKGVEILSDKEKDALSLVFEQFLDLDEAANLMCTTAPQLVSLIKSAFIRTKIYLEDNHHHAA